MNSQSESGNSACLTEELIANYLEGVLTPVVKSACEVHLIACDRCREDLAVFMRLLRKDVDPEEEAELNRALAKQNRVPIEAAPARQSRVWRDVFVGVGSAAAVVVLALAIRGVFFWSHPTGEDLIQALLQNKRPFDAQLANQPYVALNTTRSVDKGISIAPLVEEMTRRSSDAYRMGRFHLASGNYDEAIGFLQTAAADPKAPPEVHNDLGVAYLQRYGNGDFERSRQELTEALSKNEKFLPAIFNLALLYERTGMTVEAGQQLKRYLDLDPDSGWARELRQKLQGKDIEK